MNLNQLILHHFIAALFDPFIKNRIHRGCWGANGAILSKAHKKRGLEKCSELPIYLQFPNFKF
jgi:hypothetical protein